MKAAWFALSAASALMGSATASAATMGDILQLINDAGCVACHQMATSRSNGSPPPLAPAWQDIAARYKSVKGAQQQLTATIMTGSLPADQGRSPYSSHWTGKVQGDFMPTHRHAISQADAARVVAWILTLEAPK